MIYIDTSSLLKLLLPEPESAAVQYAVSVEDSVIVSSLTVLEAEVQLRGAVLGGVLSRAQGRRCLDRLTRICGQAPLSVVPLSSTLFDTGLRQQREARKGHARTLDRLHLAAMEELSISRLMTHDAGQAEVARALGHGVAMPGRDT